MRWGLFPKNSLTPCGEKIFLIGGHDLAVRGVQKFSSEEHKMLFNAKKSQLLHFTKSSKSKDPQLFMNDGSIIPYVDSCNHLGNTISIKSDKIILHNAVNDLYMRTNCLLSDFSFSECSTLSHLFNTYCVNIYGSPLWKYYDKKLLELFYVAWRKSLRRVWNISNVTHNNLLPYIHNCHPIEVILEKHCIKLSGRYSTVIMHYILIYYDYLYKTVIRLWVKTYAISCLNMAL